MQQRNKARAREIQNIFECHPTSSIQGLNVTCVCSADQFLHIIPKKVVHTQEIKSTPLCIPIPLPVTTTTQLMDPKQSIPGPLSSYCHLIRRGQGLIRRKQDRYFMTGLPIPKIRIYGPTQQDPTPTLNLKILLLFRKKNLILGTNSQGDFQCKTLKKKHE